MLTQGMKDLLFSRESLRESKTLYDNLYYGNQIVNKLAQFRHLSGCIIANRYDAVLDGVAEKVYTQELFRRD